MKSVAVLVTVLLVAVYLALPGTVSDHSALKDKVVVITDAASGVGKSSVKAQASGFDL